MSGLNTSDFQVHRPARLPKHVACRSIFLWQPRAATQRMLAGRRAELKEAGRKESEGARITVQPTEGETVELADFVAAHVLTFMPQPHGKATAKTAAQKVQCVNTIVAKLFPGATRLQLRPLQCAPGRGRLWTRLLVNHTGRDGSGLSMLFLGSHSELEGRAAEHEGIVDDLKGVDADGSLASSFLAPRRPVAAGDENFSGARDGRPSICLAP